MLVNQKEKRALATIRKVHEIIPIDGADFIELAKVDGWQCVVKKGEFAKNDMCVYFEIDSYLPIDDRFEFLRKSSYKRTVNGDEGFRLKTIRLRKTLSQGLLLPIDLFPEIPKDMIFIGSDVTNILHVTKWDPPIPAQLAGECRGLRPSFVPKTDQERIQNLTEVFEDEKYKNLEFEASEKIDGSSMSVYYNAGDLGVTSRNMNLKLDQTGNSYVDAAKKYNVLELLNNLQKNIVLQGELCGPGIQKNPLLFKEIKWFIFDIFDIDLNRYLLADERANLLETIKNMGYKLDVVPIIQPANKLLKFPLSTSVDELLNFVFKKQSTFCSCELEGIVFKSKTLIDGQVFSFKVINNSYLM